MTDQPSNLFFPAPFSLISLVLAFPAKTHVFLSRFLNNLIHNSTVPRSFETYPEDIYTIPLIREHHDFYLYYTDTHSLTSTPHEPHFSLRFTSPRHSTNTFRKNINPSSLYIPIAHVFTTFLKNLSEENILLPQLVFTPSAIQSLLKNETYFELLNIEQLRTLENNPHYWPITDILQMHHFQR